MRPTIDDAAASAGELPLPGGQFAVGGAVEWLRTLLGVAWFLGPALWAVRLAARFAPARLLHRLERWWARSVAAYLRMEVDIEGIEHIDPRERYVVVALHEGFADALALAHLPLDLRVLARRELLQWRALGGYLRDSHQLVVDEDEPARGYRELLRRAPAIFAAGESVLVFPQGTILGLEIAFQHGAFRLAERSGRPLLPVVLSGSHRVWAHPFGRRLRYGERVSVRVLPPLPAHALRACAPALEREMRAHALDGAMAPPRRFDPDRDGYWDGYRYAIAPEYPALAAQVAAHRRRAHGAVA